MTDKRTLQTYVDDVASDQPTPGGGSVSAVVGSLSAALGAMSCQFTLNRKGYEDNQVEVGEILSAAKAQTKRLLLLAREDEEAYGAFHHAFSLPRSSEEEKTRRRAAIQEAALGAMEVPLDVARRSASFLPWALRLLEIGNKNLITDVGVMAILAAAACQGALLNVLVNLPSLGDGERKVQVRKEAMQLEETAVDLRDRVLRKVHESLSPVS